MWLYKYKLFTRLKTDKCDSLIISFQFPHFCSCFLTPYHSGGETYFTFIVPPHIQTHLDQPLFQCAINFKLNYAETELLQSSFQHVANFLMGDFLFKSFIIFLTPLADDLNCSCNN